METIDPAKTVPIKDEGIIEWLKCPWCGDERMRLWHGLCIDCGRDVRGFRNALRHMSLPGAKCGLHILEWGRRFPKEYRTAPGMFMAVLELGMRKVRVTCDTAKIYPLEAVLNDDGSQSRRFSDTLRAWKDIRAYLTDGTWEATSD